MFSGIIALICYRTLERFRTSNYRSLSTPTVLMYYIEKMNYHILGQNMIFEQFDRNELILINDLIFRLNMLESEEEYKYVLFKMKELLSFDTFIIVFLDKSKNELIDFIDIGFPLDFLSKYYEDAMYEFDPRWVHFGTSAKLFQWFDIYKELNLSPESVMIKKLTREGLIDGITYECQKNIYSTNICFMNNSIIPEKDVFRNKCLVRIFGNHLMCAARNIFQKRLHKHWHITEQQKHILSLLIKGHKRQAIAEITQLSPKSVDTHLDIVRKKFNVNTRRELIVVAKDILNLDEEPCDYENTLTY